MSSDRLNRLYSAYFGSSPKAVTMDMPESLGSGHIAQVITKQGTVLSEWSFTYDKDIRACGKSSSNYVHFLFCMGEDIAWEATGIQHDICLSGGMSCVYCGQDRDERVCYQKGKEYIFQSLRVSTDYIKELLENYFEDESCAKYKTKLLTEVSKIQITPYMEHIFSEIKGFEQYRGGIAHLFLDSKVQELLAAYMNEVFEIDMRSHTVPRLLNSECEAIKNAKLIIDSQLAYAPNMEQLARLVGLSISKLGKGFSEMYGMPVHAYIIDRRLEKAACMLMAGEHTVTQIASMVGYNKPSNFSAAFKRKYGTLPKEYKKKNGFPN
ncbi:MAG: helix-turn-helix transcriptional regulator [Clostridia bacterium]|nr:helix-turn-helix transcriptional regulator [Clostridia bacterium]MBR2175428.1 helix-turn-helix transcriptional regulator [Clostridia bacterium]